MSWLIGVERDGSRRMVEIEKNEITIGRHTANDLILDDPDVDRRHARIVVKDGRFIIVDLASTSGTFQNGERINSPRIFEEGEVLRIGPFNFWMEDASLEALGLAEDLGDRELELLELVAREPADDEPRLVYADYLMDRGDPRGEFISLQVELSQARGDEASALEIRLRELALRTGDEVLQQLIGRGIRFERGFVAESFSLSPFRRERSGTGIYRVSPAIYEIGRAFGGTRRRARRFTAQGSEDVVVSCHRGSASERIADNQLTLGRLISSPRFARVFELVSMGNRRADVGVSIEWPSTELSWEQRFRSEVSFSVADIAHAAASVAHAIAELHATEVDGRDAGLRAGIVLASSVIAEKDHWVLADLPAMVARDGLAPYPFDTAREAEPSENQAPETFRDGAITVASDVYCVGLLARSALQTMRGHASESPEPGSRASALAAINARATALEPGARYQSATELADAYAALAGAETS